MFYTYTNYKNRISDDLVKITYNSISLSQVSQKYNFGPFLAFFDDFLGNFTYLDTHAQLID